MHIVCRDQRRLDENGRVWWCGAPIRLRHYPISLPSHVGEYDRLGLPAFREDGGVRRGIGMHREARSGTMGPYHEGFGARGSKHGG